MKQITEAQKNILALKILDGIKFDAPDEGTNSLEIEIETLGISLIINADIYCDHVVEFDGNYTHPAEGHITKTLVEDSLNIQIWDNNYNDDYFVPEELYHLVIQNINLI